MIAIHTALYIFKPRHSKGEGGLYPYRNYAYSLWVIFPVVMASLAFINDQDAYTTEGTYCYLPVRPFWYRLALGWIPRYLIFIFILGIYASIYYYVRYKFHGFNKVGKAQSDQTNTSTGSVLQPQRPLKRNSIPPTPTLACHGLIPESRQASVVEDDKRKSAIESSSEPSSGLITGAHRFMWASLKAPDDFAPTPPSEPSILEVDSFVGPSTPQPILQSPSAVSISPRPQSFTPLDSRATSWRDGFVRRFSPDPHGNSSTKHSIVDIFTVLRQHPNASEVSTPLSQLQLMNSRGQTFADAEMLRTRDKIRRQLRFLFIYPLVYIGMWILPFISHVLQYDDRYALNPPFGLTCITTICICSQAAVDSWLFSTREKPWRHIPGGGGGFWESLKFWSGGTWNSRKTKTTHGPGKTREEMVREARAAYKRRDEELAQRKTQANVSTPHRDSQKTEKSWWEASGLDGTMSPVAEETLNPMEAVIVSDSATLSPISEHSPSDSEATSTTARSAEALEAKDDTIESVSKKEQG